MPNDVSEALYESEQRYRTLFEQAPVGVFLYDREFTIHDFNERFPEILRSTPERLRGLDLRKLRDRRIVPTLERALGGEPCVYEGPYETTTSSARIHISLRVAPLRDTHDQVVGAMGLAEDVTERFQAERALRRSEVRFRALIENSPDAIAVYPPTDRRLVYANPAFARMLGYGAPSDVLGRPMDALVHPDDRATLDRRWMRLAAASGALPPQEYRMLRADTGHVSAEFVSMLIEYDERPHVIAFGRDLTDRKQMQARLLLTDRLTSIGTLAAGVAHEINNPLAYAMTNLDVVASRRLPDMARRLRAHGDKAPATGDEVDRAIAMIEVALEGCGRIRDIVRDLRTFTRDDEERRAPVDVTRVLDASINLAWNEIRHRATLTKEYGAVRPVMANEARLGQVFLNLLVNAAQALPVGGAAAHEIRVSARTEGDARVVVEVHDTGPGIAAENAARIFDPFFTTKPVGEGTGLGLWICQRIVSELGGHIAVESEPGGGASFRVTLPAFTPTPTRPPPEASARELEGERLRLLVIDDELALGRSLAIALADEFEVETVASGREALDQLAADAGFDVVLCDLMMPDVSGMDVYEAILSRSPELAARFVLVTGGAFTDRARAFVASVEAPVVEKPFDLEALPALLRKRAAGR